MDIPVSRRMVDIVEIDKVTPHEAVLSDRRCVLGTEDIVV